MGRAINPNCFTLRFPVKPNGVGRIGVGREGRRRRPYSNGGGLPDAAVPTARIERMLSDKPKFQPNRRGWARFHRWQEWHHRRLALMADLCGWRPASTPPLTTEQQEA